MRTVPSRPDPSSPLPPKAKDQAKKLTVKQERDARRAEKVAAMVAEQKRHQRNRRFAWIGGSVAAVAVVALVVGFVVSSEPKVDPASISIGELKTYDDLTSNHVSGTVDYPMTPPAGGDHAGVWLNCGIYSEPVPNENAVHDLEHGTVWITYDPDLDGDDVDTLAGLLPQNGILSPYDGLDAPVVVTVWGRQLPLDGADDPRLPLFIDTFGGGETAPEPFASCAGGVRDPDGEPGTNV